ncbi:hypothetical protein PR003_g27964 [Phytophthora rubi]|uniref:Uncharacterized protein n=1 Tax=Phytophthora rubi TaxID=129364 RepID=A0A6A4C2Q3_9STRA|nr:hypothetical protein PR003_g27964 [Phytophthora rubi]
MPALTPAPSGVFPVAVLISSCSVSRFRCRPCPRSSWSPAALLPPLGRSTPRVALRVRRVEYCSFP